MLDKKGERITDKDIIEEYVGNGYVPLTCMDRNALESDFEDSGPLTEALEDLIGTGVVSREMVYPEKVFDKEAAIYFNECEKERTRKLYEESLTGLEDDSIVFISSVELEGEYLGFIKLDPKKIK